MASDERVTRVATRARTNRVVVGHKTFGVGAACSSARIATVQIDTGQSWRTFRACHTFRTTFRRYAQVARLTRANWRRTHRPTDAVGAARRRTARLHNRWRCRRRHCTIIVIGSLSYLHNLHNFVDDVKIYLHVHHTHVQGLFLQNANVGRGTYRRRGLVDMKSTGRR